MTPQKRGASAVVYFPKVLRALEDADSPPLRLTLAERETAVRVAHRRKWSDRMTASRIHCADRTVLRIRTRLGLAAWPHSEIVKYHGY